MKKLLIATLVPFALFGLLMSSASWFLAGKDDRIVHELMKTCIDRGYTATSSIEKRFLSSSVTLRCVKSTSMASSQ